MKTLTALLFILSIVACQHPKLGVMENVDTTATEKLDPIKVDSIQLKTVIGVDSLKK